MTRLSNHTLLMNMMIGLCKKVHGWQSILRDLGYEVDWIEPQFINSEGRKVVPDLMLTSNKLLHSLIVECKGGKTLNIDQIDRLSKLEVDRESIVNRASVYDVRRLEMDVCFAVFGEYLKDILGVLDNLFPLLVFSNVESVKLKKLGEFKSKQLNFVLSHEIQLGSFPPTEYIPFTDEDDENIIAMYIIQELVSRAMKLSEKDMLKFDANDLLSSIHPLWKKLDEGAKKKLRNKVNNIIREIILRKLKHSYLEKLKGRKGRSTWMVRSLQKFKEECEELLRDLREQKKLEDFNF